MEREGGNVDRDTFPPSPPHIFLSISSFASHFTHFLSIYKISHEFRGNLNIRKMHYEEIILKENSLRESLTTCVSLASHAVHVPSFGPKKQIQISSLKGLFLSHGITLDESRKSSALTHYHT